ncbi:23 kDa integral membrane protein-like isoform X1 [Diorhabda carinulata]|uniref:23 kDa integral membrane protein-like isoform X1 n=1 Tax=Diorhabda carinulata TaxID=1163345 RepID=UPI0025A10352|nr:23 kDa integral membrane protein-like isoform X1 [Diorhabda carinulata]
MGCDEDILKCLVFWTNFILALVGIVLISLGIIYKISLEEISNAIPKEYEDLIVIPVLTIPLGTVLIFLAVFGCYGCLTERIKYVALYIAILLVVFILQLTIGVNSFYKIGNVTVFQNRLDTTVEDIFENYTCEENANIVDLIQHRLKCCGYNGSKYWIDSIPSSCRKVDSNDIFENPCNIEISNYIRHCQIVLGISICLLSLAEFAASIISVAFVYYLKIHTRSFIFIKDCTFDNGLL